MMVKSKIEIPHSPRAPTINVSMQRLRVSVTSSRVIISIGSGPLTAGKNTWQGGW